MSHALKSRRTNDRPVAGPSSRPRGRSFNRLTTRLLDRQRALLGPACRLKLPEMLLHNAEVAERDRDLGMLRPVYRLEDRQRALLGPARRA